MRGSCLRVVQIFLVSYHVQGSGIGTIGRGGATSALSRRGICHDTDEGGSEELNDTT
jgi:hypothetical protein